MVTPLINRSLRVVLCVMALVLALLPSAVSAAPAEAVAVQAGEGCSSFHTVSYGQTLSGIARWYGVSVHSLQRVNYLPDPNRIYAGQVLCIPLAGGHPGGATHVVQRGETLYSIARMYGTTWQCLAHRNHIANPNYIRAGQVLYIVHC